MVEKSHFDEERNSVYLMCKDATVNYHNPYMTVFCRHNHDIKCILSGEGARAAMMYISDYITKFDFKTHQVLSLLSKAVMRNEHTKSDGPISHAKMLLHKCMSQLTGKQQIHAQQAVRYLRGNGDAMESHKTVAMLSSLAVYEFDKLQQPFLRPTAVDGGLSDDEEDEDGLPETEELMIALQTDQDGEVVHNQQVMDYMYRSINLSALTFYDFAREYTVVRKNTANILHGHSLEVPHPLHSSHVLTHRAANSHPRIPRVIGMKVPRESAGENFFLFMLAHFQPW